MKILQINVVYKKGSTGKITYDIHTELQKEGIESVVCYGRGEKYDEKNVYKTCGECYSKMNNFLSRIRGIMYGGCFFSTQKLIRIIKKEKPDIIHLQCINGYFVNVYRLLKWLKANHIRTVVTLHAEFMYTGGCSHSIDCNQWSTSQGCSYSKNCPRWRTETKSLFFNRTGTMWKLMKKAFDGFDEDKLVIVSVSPWLKERAAISHFMKQYFHNIVFNGIDTDIFHVYDRDSNDRLKEELKIKKNDIVIFHATAGFTNNPNHIKGGFWIIELAQMLQDIKFVVAGAFQSNVKVPDNLILLGRIAEQKKLAQLYSMADLTVLTSRKETFSMVTAESLCCGTPVVGFKAGAPEMIALKEYSNFVEYGDIQALKDAVVNMLNQNMDSGSLEVSAEIYSKKMMTRNYIDVYKKLLNS